MGSTFGIWNVDEQTKYLFRIISVARGMTGAELLKAMLAKEWEEAGQMELDEKTSRSFKATVKQLLKKGMVFHAAEILENDLGDVWRSDRSDSTDNAKEHDVVTYPQ